MTDSDSRDNDHPHPHAHVHDWTSVFAQDLRAIRPATPLGTALMATGGFTSLLPDLPGGCKPRRRSPPPFVPGPLGVGSLFAFFWAMRAVAGRDWIKESPTIGLIVRVWITFLILSFQRS